LTSPQLLQFLSEAYVYDLTGASLQSPDQLFAACRALGLHPERDMKLGKKHLRRVFDARNQIVHEMDIDFEAPRRNRFQRRIEDTIGMVNDLLKSSARIVEQTHKKLTQQDIGPDS